MKDQLIQLNSKSSSSSSSSSNFIDNECEKCGCKCKIDNNNLVNFENKDTKLTNFVFINFITNNKNKKILYNLIML